MKRNYLKGTEIKRRENLKLFKLLNNEDFWMKLNRLTLSRYRLSRLREYRLKLLIPSKKLLESFINEDYRIITWDTRETRDIILDLLTEE